MLPTVYIETIILSYLTARPARDVVSAGRQQGTLDWWERRRSEFLLYASELVLEEAAAGDQDAAARRIAVCKTLHLLRVDEDVAVLAEGLATAIGLPVRARADAVHVALAAVHGIDYLLTWNLRHIANAELRPRVDRECRMRGYRPPILCTPDELMGIREEENRDT